LKTLKPILIVALLIGGCVAFERIDRSRNTPPATVQMFDDYMKWQTKHRHVSEWRSDGEWYVLMSGPHAGVLPSGSTVYVFNSSGRMVDWTLDGGDDSRFQERWYYSGQPPYDGQVRKWGERLHEITLDEVKKRFAATRPAS
jgi:hypothetical protein